MSRGSRRCRAGQSGPPKGRRTRLARARSRMKSPPSCSTSSPLYGFFTPYPRSIPRRYPQRTFGRKNVTHPVRSRPKARYAIALRIAHDRARATVPATDSSDNTSGFACATTRMEHPAAASSSRAASTSPRWALQGIQARCRRKTRSRNSRSRERRQPDGSPIRPQEGEIGSGVAGGHFLTFSSLTEVMAEIDCILDRIRFATSFQNPHAKPRWMPRTRPECARHHPAAAARRPSTRPATKSTAPYSPTLASHASRDTARTGSAGRPTRTHTTHRGGTRAGRVSDRGCLNASFARPRP